MYLLCNNDYQFIRQKNPGLRKHFILSSMDKNMKRVKKDFRMQFINLLDELYGESSLGMWCGVQRDLSIPACN